MIDPSEPSRRQSLIQLGALVATVSALSGPALAQEDPGPTELDGAVKEAVLKAFQKAADMNKVRKLLLRPGCLTAHQGSSDPLQVQLTHHTR